MVFSLNYFISNLSVNCILRQRNLVIKCIPLFKCGDKFNEHIFINVFANTSIRSYKYLLPHIFYVGVKKQPLLLLLR